MDEPGKIQTLHPKNPKLRILALHTTPTRSIQPHPQHLARMTRGNNAIVPKPSSSKQDIALTLDPIPQPRVDLLPHGLHHRTQLLRPHDTRLSRRPRPQKPRTIRATTHTVIPRACTGTHDDGELRDIRTRHSGDEFSAVLRDPAFLGILADHEAGDVLEEDEGDVALAAELDEVGALEAAFGEEDAVVGDDADGPAVQGREPRDKRAAVEGFEFGEGGAVDDAGDDFVHGDVLFEVRADDAVELGGVMERFFEGSGRGWDGGVVEVADASSGEDEGVCVVDGEIVCYPGHLAVEFPASEFFGGDFLAGCSFD